MNIAIVHPTGLLGEALREELDRVPELWRELGLFTADETEVGSLTDTRDGAAFVKRWDAEEIERYPLVFLCGAPESHADLLDQLPPGSTPILLPSSPGTAEARPIVVGVNDEEILSGERLLSAHPAVVLLARLLAPLRDLGLRQATATVTLPASITGRKDALDELFEQTRSLLAFSGQRPQAIFGRQLAFNLYAVPPVTAALGEQLRAVLPGLDVAVQALQAGVFHGIGASVSLRFRHEMESEELREALLDAVGIEFTEDEEPSPVDAASREEILLGELSREGESHGLWAVMDNLTTGSAKNAVGILKVLSGG